jgi:hypothetical protein
VIDAEPGVLPVATPVTGSIVAVAELLLVQIPPVNASDKEITAPVHTIPGSGVIAGREALTVTEVVTKQPPAIVYDITDDPDDTPVTAPAEVIAATLVFALLHVPEGVISLSDVIDPKQMFTVPEGVIAAGAALTVTLVDAEQPVGIV